MHNLIDEDFELEFQSYIVGIEDNIQKIEMVDAYRNKTRLDKHVQEDFEELTLQLGIPLPNIKFGVEGYDYYHTLDAELDVAVEGFFSAIGDFISKIVGWVIEKFNQLRNWIFGIVEKEDVDRAKTEVRAERNNENLATLIENDPELLRLFNSKEKVILNSLRDKSSIRLLDIPGIKAKDLEPMELFLQLLDGDTDNVAYMFEDISDSLEVFLETVENITEFLNDYREIPANVTDINLFYQEFLSTIYNTVPSGDQLSVTLQITARDMHANVTADIRVPTNNVPSVNGITEIGFNFATVSVNIENLTFEDINEFKGIDRGKDLKPGKTKIPGIYLEENLPNVSNLNYAGERPVHYDARNTKGTERKLKSLNKKINKANTALIKPLTSVMVLCVKETQNIGRIIDNFNKCKKMADNSLDSFVREATNKVNEAISSKE